MNKRTKRVIVMIAVLVVACAVYGGIYLADVNAYKAAVENITYSDVDISSVADGEYIGECNVGFIYARVCVTVSGGVITDIDLLEHRNERGGKAQGIENEIVAQQKVNVDNISGATNSSKVIKKAVDNALAGAGK